MEKYTGFSGHASLATVGLWLNEKQIWKQIEERVQIKQKVVRYKPSDKLKDLLINILAGGQGVADVNQRVRVDKSLQLAFGRDSCAEQSTISETLNASSRANVEEFAEALKQVYQAHGRGYRHEYEKKCQVLDIDLSAMLAGQQAEGATKGYFSGHENRRGRQLGRILASLYDEIVAEKLYPGTIQLEKNLPELIQMAENVLELDEDRRSRTILRVDAGGGTDANINFCLNRDYFVLLKAKNWQRICKLMKSVVQWQALPHLADHECGWVSRPHDYVRPTRQIAIRWPNPHKSVGWSYAVLVFNLPDDLVFELARLPLPSTYTDLELMAAVVTAYDLRGGGVETSYKNSKQGMALHKRNKKCFQAQEMLILLAQLAYNLIHWVQQELAQYSSTLASFGTLRMIRDAFQIAGKLEFDPHGHLRSITLNHLHKFALPFLNYGHARFASSDLSFLLGEI